MPQVRAHHRRRPTRRTFKMRVSPEARASMLAATGYGREYPRPDSKKVQDVIDMLTDILGEFTKDQILISRSRLVEMRAILEEK